MQSRRTNINGTQTGRIGSKTSPIGMTFKGVKNVGKSDDLDLGLSGDEVLEMLDLEGTEFPKACRCGAAVPLGTIYKNIPDLEDAIKYLDKSAHQSVKRYYELKERSK